MRLVYVNFVSGADMCGFINRNGITREQIQKIAKSADRHGYDLFYWDN